MRTHPSRVASRAAVLWILLGLLICAEARAQQPRTPDSQAVSGTGAVAGQVIETDGTPVPGVFVVLEGPAPDEQQRRVRADDDARFRFDYLPPGDYRLTVQLPGLAAPANVHVTVREDEVVETNAVLSLFAYDVDVEVVARSPRSAPVIDRDEASPTFELEGELLEDLPLEAEQVLEALPLLPGVVRGPSGLVSIGGSLPQDTAFLFNGLDLIDPFSGSYRLKIPLESVGNMSLYRGSYAASYGDSIGGMIDVSTAPARDEWETRIAGVIPRPWFGDGGIRGVRRANPRLRLAGPMIPGELYFAQTLGYELQRPRVFDVPGGEADRMRSEGWQWLTQVDWRGQGPHHLSFVLFNYPQTDTLAGLDGLTPVETTTEQDHRSSAGMLRHQVKTGDRSYVTTGIQLNKVGLEVVPRDQFQPRDLIVRPDGFAGQAFHRQDRDTRHWQVRSTYTQAFGEERTSHLLEIGGEAHGLSTTGRIEFFPVSVVGADGDPIRRFAFTGGEPLDADKLEASFFLQDRWRPSDDFWLDLGLRVSQDGVTRGLRIAPRVGLAWDVFGDRRALLKASTGLLHRRVFLGEELWPALPTRVETRFLADGSRSVQAFQPTRPDALTNPRAWVGSVEISYRLSAALTLHGRWTRRETRNRPVFDLLPGRAVLLETGDSLEAGLTEALAAPGELRLTPTGEASYHDLELTAAWRLGGGSQVFVSYVHSRAEGDLNDFTRLMGEAPDPILHRNERARLPIDSPNRVVAWGRLFLPWDLIAAVSFEYRDGFPFSVLAEDQSYLGEPMTRRFPDFMKATINVTKGFRLGGQELRAGLMLRNLGSHFNPRNVIANAASPRFGEFLNSEGLKIRFRTSASF